MMVTSPDKTALKIAASCCSPIQLQMQSFRDFSMVFAELLRSLIDSFHLTLETVDFKTFLSKEVSGQVTKKQIENVENSILCACSLGRLLSNCGC